MTVKTLMTMEEREKEAIEWTLEHVISWRSELTDIKDRIEKTLDDTKGWDCSAMWSLKDVYVAIENFLDDTDPDNDDNYGVES